VTARTVRAAIAEDEPQARRTLRTYLEGVDWIELAGEANDGAAAVRLVDELEPDLLFLDVRLPELTGLQVIERIHHRPALVFTTAHDRFAVAAFELGAVDYLLKPFGAERFGRMLERVRAHMDAPAAPDAVERTRLALSATPLRRLFVRSGARIVPIPVESIRRIQAAGDYAEVHCAAGRFLLQVSLGELLSRLDPERFRQVHRSHIVNLDHVQEMKPYDERRLLIRVEGGGEVLASRKASEELRRLAR
jgi:two-component system, LytTR family, response regulator